MSLPDMYFPNSHLHIKQEAYARATSATCGEQSPDCDSETRSCDILYADVSDTDSSYQQDCSTTSSNATEKSSNENATSNGAKRQKKKRTRDRSPLTTFRLKRQRRTKANDRERNRMHGLNEALDMLRRALPKQTDDSKMTKIDTLRTAVVYIYTMQKVLRKDSGIYDPTIEEKTMNLLRHMPAEQQQVIISKVFPGNDNLQALATTNSSLGTILHHVTNDVSGNSALLPYPPQFEGHYPQNQLPPFFGCENALPQQPSTSIFDDVAALNVEAIDLDSLQTSLFQPNCDFGFSFQEQNSAGLLPAQPVPVSANCNNNNNLEAQLPPVSCMSNSLQTRRNLSCPITLQYANAMPSPMQGGQLTPVSPIYPGDPSICMTSMPYSDNSQIGWSMPPTPSDNGSQAGSSPYQSPQKQIMQPDVGHLNVPTFPVQMLR